MGTQLWRKLSYDYYPNMVVCDIGHTFKHFNTHSRHFCSKLHYLLFIYEQRV